MAKSNPVPRRESQLFDLVIAVDWSAAATPGPKRPAPDRCWLAWRDRRETTPAEYFRTRLQAEDRVRALLHRQPGSALVAWDFPHGYPAGSGLGGGRDLAHQFAGLISDGADGQNNRFVVAAALNRQLGAPPGPLWGCPTGRGGPDLGERKSPFTDRGFDEWRLVDRRVRAGGRNIQSAWKLYTTGSVGSQILMGLPTLYRLLTDPDLGARSRLWPFETDWDTALGGIVHAEMWPSLADHQAQAHPIKDARQVQAARDWIWAEDQTGRLRGWLTRPAGLTSKQSKTCLTEEGWILGVA